MVVHRRVSDLIFDSVTCDSYMVFVDERVCAAAAISSSMTQRSNHELYINIIYSRRLFEDDEQATIRKHRHNPPHVQIQRAVTATTLSLKATPFSSPVALLLFHYCHLY